TAQRAIPLNLGRLSIVFVFVAHVWFSFHQILSIVLKHTVFKTTTVALLWKVLISHWSFILKKYEIYRSANFGFTFYKRPLIRQSLKHCHDQGVKAPSQARAPSKIL